MHQLIHHGLYSRASRTPSSKRHGDIYEVTSRDIRLVSHEKLDDHGPLFD